jgi:signal transduction histidine kinase
MEQAATELRTLSYLLHPPLLDEVGLVAALAWYVEGFARRSGLAIGLEAPDDLERLPTDIETPLYRVVQEALSNVHRHSGSKSARIVLSKRANAVWLRIQDRGKGMTGAIAGGEGVGIINGSVAPSELGVGIAGMRQRLRQIGGRLEIRSTAHGTTITAVVPLARNTGHSGVSGSEHSASEAGTA